MWDEFQIGDKVKSNSAVVIKGYNLSHNSKEYWWRSDEFNIGGRINKDSDVGRFIKNLIETKVPPEELEYYILNAALSAMESMKILDLINKIKRKAFKDGEKSKAAELRSCLGISQEQY